MTLKASKTLATIALSLSLLRIPAYSQSLEPEHESGVIDYSQIGPQLMGILTTRDNAPILVNGAKTTSGTTIISGSTLETLSDVGATVNVGAIGSVCIAPKTTIKLEFTKDQLTVKLISGCVILTTNKNVRGSVFASSTEAANITSKETPNQNKQNKQISIGGTLDVCFPLGAPTATVNADAAANAGAGASGMGCNPPAGAAAIPPGGLFGLGLAATVAIFAGTGAIVAGLILGRGTNPSPS